MKKIKKSIGLLLAAIMLTGLFSSTNIRAAKISIPSDALSFGGHYYSIYSETVSWTTARNKCKELGGYLVTITSAEEQTAVWEYIKSKIGRKNVWIGMHYDGKAYVWDNGEKVDYTYWYPGQPDGPTSEGHAHIWGTETDKGSWNDNSENGKGEVTAYVCEWDNIYNINLDVNSIKLYPGESYFIEYEITYADSGKKVNKTPSFKSSSKTIAKVSSKGKVVAVKPGVCTINVSYKDNSSISTVIVLPDAVKGLKSKNSTRKNISLTWKEFKGVNGYQIFMYDPDLEEYTKVKTITKSNKTSATITNLSPNTEYKFKIRAYVKSETKTYYGDFSDEIIVKTSK